MTHILSHKYQNLWIESSILDNLMDEDSNAKPLSQMLKEVQKYAISRAMTVEHCSKANATSTDEYKNTFGWMGEVLCEFWLKVFGHKYDIVTIQDTSQNQFQRGYDFTGSSIFDSGFNAIIQIKMQSKTKAFEFGKLFTFLDEAEKASSLPQYTVLMVPTSILKKDEILSYKKNFKLDYQSKIKYIGQNAMDNEIAKLPSLRFKNGNLEFFTRFKESLHDDSFTCVTFDY
jgi:hypothetical protein